MSARRLFPVFFLAILVSGSLSLAGAANIVIINKDPAGVGFNDPTPAAPVGGNSGTTLGAQRLNVFSAAANIWGAKLTSSITIKIAASFGPLTPCSSGSGVIGSAGPTTFFANFTGAPRLDTWYPVALASALSGTDLAAGEPDGAAIQAQFNSNIGTAGCLTGTSWYLGLDANHGSQIDLETVLLHEFGHGLGFVGLVDLGSGAFPSGRPDPFAFATYDNTQFLRWTNMTDGQRLTSITNTGNVVFDGTNVTAGAATILSAGKDASNHPKLFTPNPIQSGSSIYHFDTTASPNQLMEPVITSDLTHNVDAPNDLTAKAMYDIGWQAPASVVAPTNVVATGTSSTNIQVTWTNSVSGGVTGYNVYRTDTLGGAYTKVGSLVASPFSDTVSTNTAYLYYVTAVAGSESPASNLDFGVGLAYAETLSAGSTTIKASHLTELRTAASALRTLANLGATSFAESIVAGTTTAKASHITELQTYISAARTTMGFSAGSYSTTPAIGSTISIADINDLRNAAK